MISKGGYTDFNSILDDMLKAASWRGKGAYGAPALPDFETFRTLIMRLNDEIDRRNKAHHSEFPIWGQSPVHIVPPKLRDYSELHNLSYDALVLIREGKPYEDKRDRMCEIMQNIIEDCKDALRKASAI